MYQIFLFGTPRIYYNEEFIRISRRKSLALLAYLAVIGVPKSRDELATLFYPQNDQSTARTNLRRDLFELKSSLDDSILSIESEQVSLISSEQEWVDVNEFLSMVNTVRQHHPSEQGDRHDSLCTECSKRLTQAIELYSADFMSGFSVVGSRQFEDWQFFQSETLRQVLSDILQQLIRWHSERGEFERAITYGRRWLALDPSHEPAHRQLMSLYARSGQQAAALRQYQECTERLQNELGVEPDAETSALYEAIRTRKLPDHPHSETLRAGPSQKRNIPSAVHHNLPPPDESMTGRESELEWIANQLRDDPDCRMLTLVGPGGIGKTRLAIEAAYHLVEDSVCPFCEGIYFVSLVSHSQADSIILAIADSMKLPLLPDPDQRTEQLRGYLHPKRLLLLLDNFEHLVNPQSIRLLSNLLEFAPQVKLLITSRTRLNAHFEHILNLDGLVVPQSEGDYIGLPVESIISKYSAIQLFVQRARHLKPDFSITSGNLKSVVQICRIVEGMPLGIELAAAWLDVLTPLEIMAEISRSLDFLAVKWPDRPERQHSLRAVFDSSWRLLAETERAALMALTLFQGSFSREAAQAVSGASIQLLMSLHSKSWLQVMDNGRFLIHELLCQYANQKLQAEPGSWQFARQRYCTYYATFLDHQVESIRGSEQRAAFDSISIEFENIRLTWQWLVEGDQVEQAIQCMLPALYRYTEVRAMAFELTHLIDLAMDGMAKDTNSFNNQYLNSILRTARAGINKNSYSLGINYFLLSRDQEKTVHQVWSTSGDIETLTAMGFWGILLSYLYGLFTETQIAINRLQELISHFREQNQLWELAHALSSLGSLLVENTINYINPSYIQAASQNLMEALSIFQELGDKSESGYTMNTFGHLYLFQSKYLEAIEQWQNAQVNFQEAGEWTLSAHTFMNLADVYSHLGEHESAFRNFQSAHKSLSDFGDLIGSANALSSESIYALRYSNIQHARHTRQESLSLYQEAGLASGVAWSSWELGEISRVAGDLPGAKEWFEKARILFDNLGDPTSSIFIHRGLGDIAQMSGDFTEAKKRFQKSKLQSEQTNHRWGQVYALCGLGRAEVASGELEEAGEHFSKALQTAKDMNHEDLALITLAGYASVFALLGKNEQAVELATLIINHKLSWNETKAQVDALLQTIQSLPPERFSAAQERGRDLDIEKAIKRFNLFTK
jgi:predicted ATPase/DNA-binding SARP family transcriptional activator/predicted negative regulator of RcsB-dependent stress response